MPNATLSLPPKRLMGSSESHFIVSLLNCEGQSRKDIIHKPQFFSEEKRKQGRSGTEPRSFCSLPAYALAYRWAKLAHPSHVTTRGRDYCRINGDSVWPLSQSQRQADN